MKMEDQRMAWIEERTPEEIAEVIRSAYKPRVVEDDWDRGFAAAVEKIADFLVSDGQG